MIFIRQGINMFFVEYPKCTTCKRAKNWLDEHGIEYTDRNIKEENPAYDELKEWHKLSGQPLKKFFNTSGMFYRSMELKSKLDAMSEEDQLKLLSSDGMLVKRPIIIKDGKVIVGFKSEEWEKELA